MTDILIRNVPDEDLRALDAVAHAQGLSRADFIRSRLHVEAQRVWTSVSSEDLGRLAEGAVDLEDPHIMEKAWS